jgi:hypothetical protein
MEKIIKRNPIWLSIIRWSVRIIAVLFAIILFIMFFSEDMSPVIRLAQQFDKHYLIMSLWILTPIGYLIGLWEEGLGGLISLVSNLTHILLLPNEEFGSAIIVFFQLLSILFIPSILYLLYWYFNRKVIVEANSEAI